MVENFTFPDPHARGTSLAGVSKRSPMSRFFSFLIAAGAVTATVLLITVDNPYLASVSGPVAGETNPIPAPVEPGTPDPVAAPPPPVQLEASWFSLEQGKEMTLVLKGGLPTPEVRNAILEAIYANLPELVTVKDEVVIDPRRDRPSWIDDAGGLAGDLVASVQQPELRIGPDRATIGGRSDREGAIASLRSRFAELASAYAQREDHLKLDQTRPAMETRMPLVLYLGTVEGLYRFEGSLPTLDLLRSIDGAASGAAGSDRYRGNLRLSPRTVDEPWMSSLSGLVVALLEGKKEGMELVIVDRSLTLRGGVPDEAGKANLLELTQPAREAGYTVKDELVVQAK